MSIIPKAEHDVREYLSEDKKTEILENVLCSLKNLSQRNADELSSVSVCVRDKEAFFRFDEDGYVNSGEHTYGRYFQDNKAIEICAENLSKIISDFQQLMYSKKKYQYCSDVYILCDLVILHEYMHAYQHLVESKSLTYGNRFLEEEANRRAAIILTAKWNLDEDLISIVIDFYQKKSEFGFGDIVSLDKLITYRNDIDYLMKKFCS